MELNRFYSIPEGATNAANLYLQAFARLIRYDGTSTNSNHHVVMRRFEEILNRHRFTESQFVRLARLFEGREEPGELRFSFAGDLCLGLDFFDNPRRIGGLNGLRAIHYGEFTGKERANEARLFALKAAGLWERNRDFFVEIQCACIAAIEKPFPDALLESDKIRARLQSASKKPGGVISELLLGFNPTLFEREAKRVARLRLTQTAIAIERYGIANNDAIPRSLDELVPKFLPAVLNDPFDGQRLRYKRLEGGHLLYSLGTDREDNDGQEHIDDMPPNGIPRRDIRVQVFRQARR